MNSSLRIRHSWPRLVVTAFTLAGVVFLSFIFHGIAEGKSAWGDGSPLPTSRGYEIAYFDGQPPNIEADKTTSAEAVGDRYDLHLEFLCNSTYWGKDISITLKYDTGSGFSTYNTWPVSLENTGCDGGSTPGVFEIATFIDGMGANTTFRVEVGDPDFGLFDVLVNGYSYVDWTS